MSAKKLGRFTAGLFVTLGLAFGGAFAASAGPSGTAVLAAHGSAQSVVTAQMDFDWS